MARGATFTSAEIASLGRLRNEFIKPEHMARILGRNLESVQWKLSALNIGYPFGHWHRKDAYERGCRWCNDPVQHGQQFCDGNDCFDAYAADERTRIEADIAALPVPVVTICPICHEVNDTGYPLHTKACFREREARKRAERTKLMIPLIQEGLPILTIAARLEISPGSVKKLRREILDRRAA